MCGAQVQRHQRKSDWEFEPVTRTLTNLLSWTEKTQSPEGSRSEDDKSNGHPNHSRPCIILPCSKVSLFFIGQSTLYANIKRYDAV